MGHVALVHRHMAGGSDERKCLLDGHKVYRLDAAAIRQHAFKPAVCEHYHLSGTRVLACVATYSWPSPRRRRPPAEYWSMQQAPIEAPAFRLKRVLPGQVSLIARHQCTGTWRAGPKNGKAFLMVARSIDLLQVPSGCTRSGRHPLTTTICPVRGSLPE